MNDKTIATDTQRCLRVCVCGQHKEFPPIAELLNGQRCQLFYQDLNGEIKPLNYNPMTDQEKQDRALLQQHQENSHRRDPDLVTLFENIDKLFAANTRLIRQEERESIQYLLMAVDNEFDNKIVQQFMKDELRDDEFKTFDMENFQYQLERFVTFLSEKIASNNNQSI